MTQTAAATTFGVSMRAVNKWMALDKSGGLRNLALKRRERRPGRRGRATIYGGDEMGLRSDHLTGTSVALVGQTPIVRATGQRFGCSMIPAITNRGQLVFRVAHGTRDGALVVDCMRRLLKQCRRKEYLIVDGHPVHRSRLAPDGLLNQDGKTNALGKSRPRNRPEMMRAVRSHLYRRRQQPHNIRRLLHETHVRLAA